MNSKLMVPIAFLVAGIAIAGGLLYSNAGNDKNTLDNNLLLNIPTLLSSDHYLGNPKAPISLIEYSDYDCVFCSGYFRNIQKLIDSYGKEGKLLWIHRNMPLFQIHPDSPLKSQAAECSGKIGGEDIFWKYSEQLYKDTSLGKESNLSLIASDLNIDNEEFENCLEDGEISQKIKSQYEEAFRAGARGTPFTVIIKGDKRIPIQQSLPYSELKNIIESLLIAEE